ncbi:hypothetical protein HDU67_004501, partial [Dinochytrium kinnereticum]
MTVSVPPTSNLSAPSPSKSSWLSFLRPSTQSTPASTQELVIQPQSPNGPITEFFQEARFQARGFVTLARIIEDAAVSRFKANASNGKRALDLVIEKILEEAKAMEGKAQAAVTGVVDGI